jgi:CHAD domain-containing protein
MISDMEHRHRHRFVGVARKVDLLDYINTSLKVLAWRQRRALRRCRNQLSERAVHDLRVEIRRLLALLNLLRLFIREKHLEDARRILKKLLKRFAVLRDIQVQLLDLDRQLEDFPEAADFRKSLDKRERQLTKRLARRLRSIRPKALKQALAGFRREINRQLESPDAQAADWDKLRKALAAAFETVESLRRRIDPQRLDTIHRTRVAFKKFRYMVELLKPLLLTVTDGQLADMRAYQTLMGDIQDARIRLATLDEFCAQQPMQQRHLRKLRSEIQRRQTALIRRYLRVSDQLLDFWPSGTGVQRHGPKATPLSTRRRK